MGPEESMKANSKFYISKSRSNSEFYCNGYQFFRNCGVAMERKWRQRWPQKPKNTH